MLKDYPVYFDSTAISFTKGWQEESVVVEEQNQSESGNDLLNVVRVDKLTINVDTTVTSDDAKVFKEFSKKDSITVKRYDILAEDYEERIMRIRDFVAEKLEKSEHVRSGNGVWHVTFKLIEF